MKFNGKSVSQGKFIWKKSDSEEISMRLQLVADNRDIKILNKLEHDTIITFSRSHMENGRFYFDSSFRMDYGNCAHLLRTLYKDGLPEVAIRLLSKCVLEALAYLHSEGIVHRAVCAHNIFLDSDGQIRLAVTQYALRISENPRWIGQMDHIHNFYGLEDVFAWLAPEVLRQDLYGYGVKSDIYSFGICLCELANGQVPFGEMDPLQILYCKPSFHKRLIQEKLRGTTPFLQDPTIDGHQPFSTALHEVVNESLLYDPNKRPSASQLLQKYREPLFGQTERSDEKLSRALPLAKKLF